MILTEGDSAAARLPFPHAENDQRGARNRDHETDESEKISKDEKGENDQKRMQADFRSDDARRQEGHFKKMEDPDGKDR